MSRIQGPSGSLQMTSLIFGCCVGVLKVWLPVMICENTYYFCQVRRCIPGSRFAVGYPANVLAYPVWHADWGHLSVKVLYATIPVVLGTQNSFFCDRNILKVTCKFDLACIWSNVRQVHFMRPIKELKTQCLKLFGGISCFQYWFISFDVTLGNCVVWHHFLCCYVHVHQYNIHVLIVLDYICTFSHLILQIIIFISC